MKRTGLFLECKELKTDGDMRILINAHPARSLLGSGSAYNHYSTSFKVFVSRLDRYDRRPETELTL